MIIIGCLNTQIFHVEADRQEEQDIQIQGEQTLFLYVCVYVYTRLHPKNLQEFQGTPPKNRNPYTNISKIVKQTAKEYMDNENITLEFTKFKNHYMANGDLKVSWEKVWENWCINHKQFKPKAPREQSTKQKEKADYKWDFRKAKEVSDRIKNWLRFDKKINWLDDYYWKDIPIPGIGWQKVMHPDFNKEEIILFKIDSSDGNFMLQHKTNDIIDAEVLEND